jgi:hypothetical protein
MITRTTIGADFEGALTYGAGVRQGDSPKKQAELIGSSNLGDVSNPRGLAAEMQSVADERSQCKNPVWHTSLSWAKGEQLSTAQKLQAAERYCELLRSQLSKKLPKAERAAYNVWEQHQVAVYEHHDKDHDHIHVYLNRVPFDGGPAIQTGHNYKFNLKAIQVISEEMNLNPLPSQRQSFNDSRPPVQDTRQVVRAALVAAMTDPQVQSLAQLQERLAAQGIEARLKRSKADELVGVSFRQGEAAVTGQDVGVKATQLRAHYEPAQRQAQSQVQRPVAADVARAQAQEQVRQALAAVLATATGGDGLSAGLAARNVSYRVNKNEAGQNVSMSFAQGEHIFEGTELSPAYSIAGMNAQIQANRQAQQPQPAAQLVPVVPVVQQSRPAAPEQRPVAAQPPAPELKPELPAPAVKAEPQKQAPTKRIRPKLG